jgi:hypothetical protein
MIVELPGTASDYSIGLASDYSIGRIKHYKMVFFHFSNNNLSIRKTCAKEIGMYDPMAKKSEDVDICFRIDRSKDWVALREKGNFLRHKARKTFSGFVKQLWGWGYHVGYPYSKTGIKGIYFYAISSKDNKVKFDIEMENFPFLVCVFLTDFHVAHLFLGMAIFSGLIGQGLVSGFFSILAVFFGWRYLYDDRRAGFGLWKTTRLSLTHYTANVVFNFATICGGLKHRILLIPSSIFRPKGETNL